MGRLTVSVLLLCRLCALVASSSPGPSPSPSTTTTVTTTDGGGWPWWAWFLVTVLPCCILLLCCGAGGAIPLFLRKKKPVATPAHVYQTPYAQPQPVPLATATRPMTTVPTTTGVPVATMNRMPVTTSTVPNAAPLAPRAF